MLKKKIIVLLGLVSCLFLITLNASATSLSEGTLDLDGQTMYVEGDFLHIGGTHMVVLSGIAEQTVYFENSQGTRFNILVNKNADGVVFKTAYRYNELKTNIYNINF